MYTAPELLAGTAEPGAASDIYAMGSSLLQVFLNLSPERARIACDQVETGSDALLNNSAPFVKELLPVLVKCVSEDPGQRWDSISSLLDALDTFQCGDDPAWTLEREQ